MPLSAHLKALCIAMLVVQNSALCLVTRYSRAVLHEQYATWTTVVFNEVLKLAFSCFMQSRTGRELHKVFVGWDFVSMAIPGLLYYLMNRLAFVGLEHLDASTYAIVSQLKILTTAIFSKLLLRRRLHWYQWRALVLLVCGVVLVQYRHQPVQFAWIGMLATTIAAILSGLAGTYTEMMLKRAERTVWERNMQLAVYGIFFGLAQNMFVSRPTEWLDGYSWVTWLVVVIHATGGILVSLTLAYMDNIVRGFATSVAIVLTALVSYVLFGDVELNTVFLCGMLTVLISVANYQEKLAPPPEEAAEAEGVALLPVAH
jgi:solute carrier family 35 (UDP-sugar transporter), member A1/2/3